MGISRAVLAMDEAEVKQYLALLLAYKPTFAAIVLDKYADRLREADAVAANAPPRYFDYLTVRCRAAFAQGLSAKSKSRMERYGNLIGVTISDAADEIVEGCMDSARIETRCAGLTALYDISKALLEFGNAAVGAAIDEEGASDARSVAAADIMAEMGDDELVASATSETGSGMRWVNERMRERGVTDFEVVIKRMDEEEEDEDGQEGKGHLYERARFPVGYPSSDSDDSSDDEF